MVHQRSILTGLSLMTSAGSASLSLEAEGVVASVFSTGGGLDFYKKKKIVNTICQADSFRICTITNTKVSKPAFINIAYYSGYK